MFAKLYPYIPIIDFNLQDRSVEAWSKVTEFLGLESNNQFIRHITNDIKVNTWENSRHMWWAKKFNLDISLDEVREAISKYTFTYTGHTPICIST